MYTRTDTVMVLGVVRPALDNAPPRSDRVTLASTLAPFCSALSRLLSSHSPALPLQFLSISPSPSLRLWFFARLCRERPVGRKLENRGSQRSQQEEET